MTGAPLTPTEQAVLKVLLKRIGRPVPRLELLERVWGITDPNSRTADVTVSRLRKKLDAIPGAHRVRTVRGEGYCVVAPEGTPVGPPVTGTVVRPPLELATARVDFDLRTVEGPHGSFSLSAVEIAILLRLARTPDRPVSANELAEAAWGSGEGAARKLTAALSRLRTKLEPRPADPVCLITLRGEGYALRLRSKAPSTLERIPMTQSGTVGVLGRDDDLARLRGCLDDHRLVTLHGPGGIGKTTLALHLGRKLAADRDHPGTVDRVELAGAATPAEFARRVADALRLLVDPGDDAAVTEALHLRGPSVLLLDNLEQAADVAREVLPRWLHEAPRLRVLATSRVLLDLRGEHALDLPPLAVEPAERLFLRHLQRGGAVHRGWNGDLAEQAATDVVRRFGGHPLAIVLAAAWATQLGPDALRRRLAAGTVPTTSTTDEHRWASLRAALDHSWQLLDDDARRAFAALAVFEGPFRRADGEAVLSSATDGAAALDRLLAHSLLASTDEDAGGVLLALHPPLREYAARRLAGSPARAAVQARHAAWLGERAEAWRAALEGPGAAAALDDLERSRADLRTALRRTWKQAPATASKHAGALAVLGRWRGREGPESSTAARATDLARSAGDPEAVARGLLEQAWARVRGGTLKQGAALLAEARRAARAARSNRLVTRVDAATMYCANLQGLKSETIRRIGREALERTTLDGDTWGEAEILRQWGYCELRAGRYSASLRMHRTGLDLVRDHGHVLREPAQRVSLAAVLDAIDRPEPARSHRHLALSQARQLGLVGYEANVLLQLATAELNRHELARAREHTDALMALVRRHATVSHLGGALHAMGLLDLLDGHVDRARRALSSALERLHEGGHRWETASVMHSLALADHLDGALVEARQRYLTALRLLGDGYAVIAAELRLELAILEARQGRGKGARQLVEAALSGDSGLTRSDPAVQCAAMAAAVAQGDAGSVEAGALADELAPDPTASLQHVVAVRLLRALVETTVG